MSKSNPPSPVHPRDLNTSLRGMADTQRPLFPPSNLIGHPERQYGAPGVQDQFYRMSQGPAQPITNASGHPYPILPPLNALATGHPPADEHSARAIPIAKLLAEGSAPARRDAPSTQYEPLEHIHRRPSPLGRGVMPYQPHPGYALHGPAPPVNRAAGAWSYPLHEPHAAYTHPEGVPHGSPFASRTPSSPSGESALSSREPRSVLSEHFGSPGMSQLARNLEYELGIRQQPAAARACGFGERDRRVVDPPPILELKIRDRDTRQVLEEETPNVYMTLHCTLVNAETLEDESQIGSQRSDMAATQRLMGTSVASPFNGKDEHGRRGTFFVFPDLSCRSPGQFKFKFRLLIVDPVNLAVGHMSPIQCHAVSEKFEVYTAKEFPGMRASSALLKELRRQGLNVAVKKGREATKKSGRKTKSEDNDSSGDEGDMQGAEDDDGEDSEGASSQPTSSARDKRKRKRE